MKQIFQLLLLLCVISTTKAQTYTPPAFADVDNNYRTYVNQVFGALESNRITTGFLADYGFDFTDPKIYNGSVLVDSTLMEQGIYSDLYKTIFTSKFNSNAGALLHPSIYDSLCYIARQKEVITLSGLLFKYNAIDPNAQANGKMQTVNGQLKDVYVNSVWQNPYQEFNTMAISPSTINYNLTYCSVVLPSNLFLTNRSSEISSIQFDAADGLGYRTIQYNTPVNLNYADTGWKRWIFRITLTNSQQLYSHTKVHFSNTSNVAGSGGAAARGVADRRRTITATEAFNGVFGVADIVISYRTSNTNDQVLRRPLIVAEGFDPGWITSPEEPEGENTFISFIRSVRLSNSATLQNLISDNPSQYDLVYVNWRNGTDFLQRNEFVLEAVIRWVNANKQPLGGVMQPNVVLGSSMGGVIARMALGRMDRGGGQNGAGGFAAHQTNLYVSLDAPHQGANVPLGYQAAARHATRMYINTGPAALTVEFIQFLRNGPSPLLNLLLADQPASKQILTNRIDLFYNSANSTNQQFLQDLKTQWAFPVNIRNVAISNGSECAIDQEFGAGSSLLYHYRSTKTRFIGDLIFMLAGAGLQALNVAPLISIPLIIPGSNKFELTLDIKALANGGGNAVYYGNIKLTKKILWLVPVSINIANKTYNAPTGILPFDSYPGGFYTITLANQPGSVSQDWMFSYNNSFSIQRRFSFIPTTSALDIGQGNTTLTSTNYLAKYIGANPPVAPFTTSFANFTTAFNQNGSQWIFDNSNYRTLNNEPHEGLFLRSANWLADEMNLIQSTTNCSAACSVTSMTGNPTICTNELYQLQGFIPGGGVSVIWSASPLNIVTIAPSTNGSQATITKSNSGNVTITATITACGQSFPVSKIAHVGGYSSSDYPITGPSSSCKNTTVSFSTVALPGATGYTWFWPAGWTNSSGQGTQYLSVRTNTTSGIVGVRVANACDAGGSPSNQFVNVNTSCGSAFILTPNPASDNVTVSATQPETSVLAKGTSSTTANSKATGFTKIRVYDKIGNLKKEYNYAKGTAQTKIDLSALLPDMYIIKVFDGTNWEEHKIIVSH